MCVFCEISKQIFQQKSKSHNFTTHRCRWCGDGPLIEWKCWWICCPSEYQGGADDAESLAVLMCISLFDQRLRGMSERRLAFAFPGNTECKPCRTALSNIYSTWSKNPVFLRYSFLQSCSCSSDCNFTWTRQSFNCREVLLSLRASGNVSLNCDCEVSASDARAVLPSMRCTTFTH